MCVCPRVTFSCVFIFHMVLENIHFDKKFSNLKPCSKRTGGNKSIVKNCNIMAIKSRCILKLAGKLSLHCITVC